MNRQVILKTNGSPISCISKINDVLFENVEDLDIIMQKLSKDNFVELLQG